MMEIDIVMVFHWELTKLSVNFNISHINLFDLLNALFVYREFYPLEVVFCWHSQMGNILPFWPTKWCKPAVTFCRPRIRPNEIILKSVRRHNLAISQSKRSKLLIFAICQIIARSNTHCHIGLLISKQPFLHIFLVIHFRIIFFVYLLTRVMLVIIGIYIKI